VKKPSHATAEAVKSFSTSDPLYLIQHSTLAEVLSEVLPAIVAEAIAGCPAEPEYVDSAAICQKLTISRSTLSRMVLEGAPCLRIGDTRRFRLADVIAWLQSREETAK
jgi:predicted DNA-binding transcriptional regulator AlpA